MTVDSKERTVTMTVKSMTWIRDYDVDRGYDVTVFISWTRSSFDYIQDVA